MQLRSFLVPWRCSALVRHSSTSCAWRHLLVGQRALVSSSRDIFSNLALEDWFYKHQDDEVEGQLLFMWRNDPCVVIGRHQNPWLECSLEAMRNGGVACARRNSGGGTVFHDVGNLNCTFFSRRSKYDRKDNLRLLCRAISSRWPALRLTISPRDDILLDDAFKISGTAAKLGHKYAYHHCTVLFNVDKRLLTSVLKRRDTMDGLESKATESVASPVKNLGEVDSSVCFEALVEAIGNEYNRQFKGSPTPLEIPVLDPTEDTFPGILDIEKQYRSWEWIFGKSPRFTLNSHHVLPPQLGPVASVRNIRFRLQVFHGIIEELGFEPNCWMTESSVTALANLVGKRFPVGSPLLIDGGHWNESDTYEREEKRFIRETIVKLTTALM